MRLETNSESDLICEEIDIIAERLRRSDKQNALALVKMAGRLRVLAKKLYEIEQRYLEGAD